MNTLFAFLSKSATRVALGTLAVTYSFTQKVGTVCQVKGSSMEPTFSNNDWVYISKFNVFPLDRGGVYLVNNDVNKLQIKRLIGKPNDIIKPRESNFQEGKNDVDKPTSSNFYKKIKNGFVWVEGDNSKVSKDSNVYGPVPISCVEGKVWGKIYPRNKGTQKNFEISEEKYFLKAD